METEIEAKFPDIHTDALRAILKEKNAVLQLPEVLMRRRNYDDAHKRLQKVNGWVRVRDEGDKITLSYKQVNDRTLHGTKEISVAVGDFDKTCLFLEAIGMKVKSNQETRREKWLYKGVEIAIDTWPWVPTFVELEGPSEEAVKGVARDLGLDWSRALFGSVETIYQMHYAVTDTEVDGWESITFITPPAWLLAKKI